MLTSDRSNPCLGLVRPSLFSNTQSWHSLMTIGNHKLDIPSFQKKVTERHREPILTRAFQSMQEITSEITQHGQRGNRGEMSQVKEFMRVNGVESAFSIVVGL